MKETKREGETERERRRDREKGMVRGIDIFCVVNNN